MCLLYFLAGRSVVCSAKIESIFLPLSANRIPQHRMCLCTVCESNSLEPKSAHLLSPAILIQTVVGLQPPRAPSEAVSSPPGGAKEREAASASKCTFSLVLSATACIAMARTADESNWTSSFKAIDTRHRSVRLKLCAKFLSITLALQTLETHSSA